MGSVFAGLSLFDSGPHRFALRAVGRFWLPPLAFDEFTENVVVLSIPIETHIVQTGRLTAPDDASLWAQVDAIQGRAEAALTSDLVEDSGRVWAGMTMLTFRPERRVDRGRVVSLGYSLDYIRLVQPV